MERQLFRGGKKMKVADMTTGEARLFRGPYVDWIAFNLGTRVRVVVPMSTLVCLC